MTGVDAHLRALIDRAQALGVVVEEGVGPGWVRLHHGMRSQLVRDGTLFESLRATADAICSQKDDCKRFLAEASIPVPEGVVVPVPGWDHEVVADLLRRCPTLVAKPVDGTDGLGVALGLKGLAEIEAYLESALGTHILLEEQIEGEDLRLQAIGGRFVCGCIRRPAEVVGDGRSSIRGLISNRNRELGALNPANRIDVDAAVESLLHAQGTTLDSVADDGSAVRL